MPLVPTGFPPLDRPHRELHRCLKALASAVRARDAEDARGRICLLGESLSEHFGEEEALMREKGWSGLAHHAECHSMLLSRVRLLERQVAVAGVTHELAAWSLTRLPELLRFHEIAADYGFGMFASGRAADPGRRSPFARSGDNLPGCHRPRRAGAGPGELRSRSPWGR